MVVIGTFKIFYLGKFHFFDFIGAGIPSKAGTRRGCSRGLRKGFPYFLGINTGWVKEDIIGFHGGFKICP